MNRKRRFFLIFLLLVVAGASITAWSFWPRGLLVEAARPEAGGWMPDKLIAQVGEPLHLRLTAVDGTHGFAVGHHHMAPVDVRPGEVTAITLLFDKPGTYTFYCTRWCGLNHWRMRGRIEVAGAAAPDAEPVVAEPAAPPLYYQLGIDIDAPHPAAVTPDKPPSAARGAALADRLPAVYLERATFAGQTPAATWQALREETAVADLNDAALWDLVAYIWQSGGSDESRATGAALYTANCIFCHGADGQGNPGIGATLPAELPNLADPAQILGAASAGLEGKIIRGGMGTGMPNWGTILTDAEVWALIDYIWSLSLTADG